MNAPMSRKLALVTGGTSGIGLGIARKLLANYDLALGYAGNDERAHASVAELKGLAPAGARIMSFKRPLKKHADCSELYGQVQHEFGATPAVLVNSAGRIDDGLFLDVDFARHAAIVEEHLISTMALCHLSLKAMYRERFGRILNLSSISASYAKRGQSNYAAAKAGIEGFTKTLALEVAHRGITVNAIAPGLIETPMTREIMDRLQEDPKEIRKRIPAGYAGQPEDVGALAAFLCSMDARYVTGQVIAIDGGRALGDPSS